MYRCFHSHHSCKLQLTVLRFMKQMTTEINTKKLKPKAFLSECTIKSCINLSKCIRGLHKAPTKPLHKAVSQMEN